MDGPRLGAVLVDGQDQAAVTQLLVQLGGCRRQQQHHRALDAIRVGREPPGRRILAGGRDRQHALALQQLERVAGPGHALVLGDRQQLVGEIRLAQVEEGLARDRRVRHPLVGREHRQQRVHQRRLPRRRGALDQHRQRLVELAGDGGEVADQRVGRLADQPAPRDIGDDGVQQVRIGEQLERGRPLGVGQLDRLGLGREGRADQLVLALLAGQQQRGEIALEDLGGELELLGGLPHEAGALARGVEIERVEVQARAPRHTQRDLEAVVAQIAPEPAHAVLPIAERDAEIVGARVRRRRAR